MADPKPLKDKVVLVTGAAQGIGAAVAKYIAARGAIVSMSDILGEGVKAIEQSIRDEYTDFRGLSQVVDISDPDSVRKWVEETKQRFGRIDGCVNNAAVFQPEAVPLTEIKLEDWRRVIDVNLTGTFLCLQNEMRAIADGGSIVNVSSVAGWSGSAYLGPYTASKHGVIGLTRSAAAEGAPRHVRVNAVCPFLVDTTMRQQLLDRLSGAGGLTSACTTLINDTAKPEEVASMISYLLGDESRLVTASIYRFDGGFSC